MTKLAVGFQKADCSYLPGDVRKSLPVSRTIFMVPFMSG